MEELIKRVSAALAAADVDGGVIAWRPVEGGHSGVTIAVDVGEPTARTFVVKASAAGERAVGRNDVLRQARALRALQPHGIRCPRVWASDGGERPFFVMDHLAGDATEPVLDLDAVLPADVVAQRASAAVGELVALHAVDPGAVELGDDAVLSVDDELDRWRRTMGAVDPELIPGADELERALERHRPGGSAPVLVHGDFRLGNVMCEGSEVTGVVDWEIWSVTDPRVDLGWFLLFCDHRHFPGISKPAPGMPTAGDLLEDYVRLSGRPVPGVEWFLAFACYKMAAIMGHNLRRHREGRRHDPYQEQLPPTIRELLRRGQDALADGATALALPSA